MKHVFKQLQIYQPTTRVGESYKPCQFKTSRIIIDLEHIAAIVECIFFEDEDKRTHEVVDWLEKKHLIMATIVMKNGSKFSNILAPDMKYFGVILNDVTF